MAIEVNRPGQNAAQKPKLSKTGRIVVAVLVVIVIGTAVGIAMDGASQKASAQAQKPIIAAVDHSVSVCREIMPAADFESYSAKIEGEKDTLKKAEAAQDMIAKAHDFTSGQASKEDELNGARNRINIAVKNYKAAQ